MHIRLTSIAFYVVAAILIFGICGGALSVGVGIGHAQVEFVIRVCDAQTGEPIPQATVEVRHENDGPLGERALFTAVCDRDGVVRHVVERPIYTRWLALFPRWIRSTVVLPDWKLRATASEYRTSNWLRLAERSALAVDPPRAENGRRQIEISLPIDRASAAPAK